MDDEGVEQKLYPFHFTFNVNDCVRAQVTYRDASYLKKTSRRREYTRQTN